jgi:hypothetical protein
MERAASDPEIVNSDFACIKKILNSDFVLQQEQMIADFAELQI